jgi:hypothetical protein
LLSPNRFLRSGADTLEVFQGDAHTQLECLGDNVLAQTVIDVMLVPPLLSTEFLQSPLRGLGSSALEGSPGIDVSSAVSFDILSCVLLPGGIGCNVDNAQIDSQELFHFGSGWFAYLGSAEQEELAVAADEIGLTFESVEFAREVFADYVSNAYPSLECQQAHSVDALETEGSFIVSNRAGGSEHRALGFITSKAFDGFSDSPHSGLRGDTVGVSKLPVAAFVDWGLAKNACVETDLGSVTCSRVESTHVRQELLGLLCVWHQSDLYN